MVPQNGVQFNPLTLSRPVYLNGRVIGYVSSGVFRKSVSASKHFLRSPKAICFDRCTLRDAEAAGAMALEVRDQETGTLYRAEMVTLWTHYFPVLRGFGDQVGLGLDYWRVNGMPSKAEKRVAESNKEIAALQMSLFGGAA